MNCLRVTTHCVYFCKSESVSTYMPPSSSIYHTPTIHTLNSSGINTEFGQQDRSQKINQETHWPSKSTKSPNTHHHNNTMSKDFDVVANYKSLLLNSPVRFCLILCRKKEQRKNSWGNTLRGTMGADTVIVCSVGYIGVVYACCCHSVPCGAHQAL